MYSLYLFIFLILGILPYLFFKKNSDKINIFIGCSYFTSFLVYLLSAKVSISNNSTATLISMCIFALIGIIALVVTIIGIRKHSGNKILVSIYSILGLIFMYIVILVSALSLGKANQNQRKVSYSVVTDLRSVMTPDYTRYTRL